MYLGFRIVVMTFVGRKRYLEILERNLERYKHFIDEWWLCWQVRELQDVEFVEGLERRHAPWTRIVGDKGEFWNYGEFFNQAGDDRTIYVKLDDDIVWMDADAIQALLYFRIKRPEFAFVSANVVNNSLMTHLHQRMGLLAFERIAGWSVFDPVGWGDGGFGEFIHRKFLEDLKFGDVQKWKFREFHPYLGERFSINVICFFGSFMKNHFVSERDEEDVSIKIPLASGMKNVWCGNALFVHYAYGPQRDYMDRTDILEEYKGASAR